MADAPPDDDSPRLLADIGGTNVRFALQRRGKAPRRMTVLQCDDHAGLAEAAEAYLQSAAPDDLPTGAAFAVASPVSGDRITLTNRKWSFSIDALKHRLGLERLEVVNDFTAVALAVPQLGADNVEKIGGGAAQPGTPIAVLGPGTGLGVSGLVPHGEAWVPLATEGGHATLPAADAREAAIIERLRARFGHVSGERALSGPGLVNLYEAIAELDGRHADALSPAQVANRARDGKDASCVAALETFCAMLGTVAGNLALSLGAQGGVYIAGGIVPRLGAVFTQSAFRARFEAKGRFAPYMEAIPTFVITHEEPAFLGLAALLDGTDAG